MAAAKYNTSDHSIFNNRVVALCGDGCLQVTKVVVSVFFPPVQNGNHSQEGVAQEAISYAGHNALDNLILFYDSNDVTLDAMADCSQSEQAKQRST